MKKFNRFYDWLCNAIIPLLMIVLIYIGAAVYWVLSGRAMGDLQFYITFAAVAFGFLLIVTWLVCSLIKRHYLRKSHGGVLIASVD